VRSDKAIFSNSGNQISQLQSGFSQPVHLGPAYSLLVSTDKPRYQPGQTLHTRILVLDKLTLRPAAGQTLRVQIQEPGGIWLADQTLPLSDWGIGSLDLLLDERAEPGQYRIEMRVRPHDPLPAHEDCETLPASGVPTAPRSGSLCSLAGQGDSAHRAMPSELTIQTFGDRINLHVHLYFLVTEGGTDEAGVFHKIPRIDDSRLAEIFAREVLAMLVRKELLSPEWAERIISWPHPGFNVHSHIFIARVTSHIPDKGQVMVRYYGLYANARIY
jgi:hypothetical protein